MSIVDELKQLILARGGSVEGVHTITDAVKVIAALNDGDTANKQTIAEGIRAIWEAEAESDSEPEPEP